MTSYRYRWVSYWTRGGLDNEADARARKRGWEPCPTDELPPFRSVAEDWIPFDRLIADFRLYRMPTADYDAMIAARPTTDDQLQAEFKAFQTRLNSIAGGKGIVEVHAESYVDDGNR